MPVPSLTIGTRGLWPFRFPYRLRGKQLRTHLKIMGLSGMGKSYFLAKAAADLILQGMPVSLIDPHSDLAHDTLRLLIESGYFQRPDAYQKLWYIDFAIRLGLFPSIFSSNPTPCLPLPEISKRPFFVLFLP